MLRKLKWQLPEELLAARYNWCQGSVPGRGPAVEKHWFKYLSPNKHSENGYPQKVPAGFDSLNSRAMSLELLHVFLYVAAIMAFHSLVFVQSVGDLHSPVPQVLQSMTQGDAATIVENY